MWQLFLNDNTRRMYLLCWSARSPLTDAIRGHAVYYRQWPEKCTYWIKCWNMITHSFNGSLSSKGPTFSKNSYMLTWRTCRLRQLEIKMSLSVIHCMSSDSICEWTAGTSTQQIHSSGVVIEEQLPHSHLKNKIHYLHIKQA
jgi:hypothetical protein